MKLLLTLIVIGLLSYLSISAQTIENPFEVENRNFAFLDMAVKGDQIYMIAIYGQSPDVICVFQFKESRWEEISNVVFDNGINRRLTAKTKTTFEPQSNPKLYIDENNDLWVTGSAVYQRKNNIWYMYRPPIKTVDFDSLFHSQFHELYFLKSKSPIVSSLITTLGFKYNGYRIGFFEMFTLFDDTLRHTNFEKNVSNVKHSTESFVDESKMTVIGDTIVVYKPNGTIFFVNPDGTIDSTEFPGNRGNLTSNLQIRQILPVGNSKLIILTDLSTHAVPASPDCCSGIFVLENRNKWTVFNEQNGLWRNIRNNYYSPRSIIPNPKGGYIVAMYANNPVGFYGQLFNLSESNMLTHIPLDNKLTNARIFPRRNFVNGVSKEMFSKIIQAISTNDYGIAIPKQEIYKIRLDGNGNLWCILDDFIMQIPAFIPTSVAEENSTNYSLLVSPNPATQSISLKSIPNSCEKIEIVSVHGQIMQTVTSNYHNINIQTLPSGVYLLKLHTKSGIQTTTFVKEF
jgi:hypothetical protein